MNADATSKFLLVKPRDASFLPQSGQEMETLIHKLLGTRTLTAFERAALAADASPILGLSVLLIRGADTLKSGRVVGAMDLLVELASKVANHNPGALHPELSVLEAGAEQLQRLRVVGEASWSTNVVYSGHPHDPSTYIRMSNFHRYLMAEKRAEFERLVAALGAKEVRMIERRSNTEAATAGLHIAAPAEMGAVGAGVGVSSIHNDREAFTLHAIFDKPASDPFLPTGLRWFHSEPGWQAMAEARLGPLAVRKRRVTFQYAEDFSVTAELAAKLQGFGLSIGGGFEEFRKIALEYDVEFYPKSKSSAG